MKARSFFNLGTLFVVLLLLPVGLVVSAPASTTWVVNTLVDVADGSCIDGSCSLRDALELASGGDTVTFSVTGTILLGNGLSIHRDLTIIGPGASSLNIDGAGAYRVFYIPCCPTVALSGLRIAHGQVGDQGGGILNWGTLTLDRCTLAENVAGEFGGGLANRRTATVIRSTFIGNQATYGGGISVRGLSDDEGGVLSVVNSTFTGNTASSRGGGIDSGSGAFYTSTLTVTNSSFVSNTAGTGGAIGSPRSVSTARNVLLAGNVGGSCSGALSAGSAGNLATDGTCAPGFGTVSLPQLALAALTGNPAYYPLQTDSAAIDSGSASGCPALDQRGYPRPLDGNGDGTAVCDVGAFEFSRFVFNHWVYLPLTLRGSP